MRVSCSFICNFSLFLLRLGSLLLCDSYVGIAGFIIVSLMPLQGHLEIKWLLVTFDFLLLSVLIGYLLLLGIALLLAREGGSLEKVWLLGHWLDAKPFVT